MSETLPGEAERMLPLPTDPLASEWMNVSEADDAIPSFGDPVWALRFLTANPSSGNVRIHWNRWPSEFEPTLRYAAWALINFPFPDEYLRMRAPSMRKRLSAGRIYSTIHQWRKFTEWLVSQGITSFEAITTEAMADYAAHRENDARISRNSAISELTAITRLWIAAKYVDHLQFDAVPPWVIGDADDHLPRAFAAGENETEAISPATIGPLLHWSLLLVEEFAPSIVEAVRRLEDYAQGAKQARPKGKGSDRDRLRLYLDGLIQDGHPVPTRSAAGRTGLDATTVAHEAGVSLVSAHAWRSWDQRLQAYFESNNSPRRFPFEVVGQTNGEVLAESVTYDEVRQLDWLLETACFIVITYLTGMRPGETLGIMNGSLQASEQSDGGWMLIRSRTFKTSRDEAGNHASAGTVRPAPWIAVTPVVAAIRVMERLNPGPGLIFRSNRMHANRSMAPNTFIERIERFVSWANDRERGLGPRIPQDKHGAVTPLRFRRTLAWHIAHQPGGLVALAVQYGHLRTAISEGYSSRSRDGVQNLIDFETARSIAVLLSDANQRLEQGEGSSGPAVLRWVNSVREGASTYGGAVMTTRQAKEMLANQHLTVFLNEESYLWCNYDSSKALCLLSTKDRAPRLDRCQRECANISRTDSQADGLELEATRLLAEADSGIAPGPMSDRLRETAERALADVAEHRRDRITLEDFR